MTKQLRHIALTAIGAPALAALLLTGCDRSDDADTAAAMRSDESTGEETTVVGTTTVVDDVDDADFARYDLDQDGRVSVAEWNDVDVHTSWDVDRDGRLNDIELSTGLYTAWDVDGNDKIDLVEFRDGSELWLEPDAEISLAVWDTDGDSMLDHDELEAGLRSVGYWDAWDTDGDDAVSGAEVDTAVYEAWDIDGDGFVEVEEWRMN